MCRTSIGSIKTEVNPSVPCSKTEVKYTFVEDNIPIVDPDHLTDACMFAQLYLIGKILGESLPIKLITAKCVTEWKPSRDISIVDMSNGFSLVKFANAMDRNRVLQGQPWFIGGQIFCLQKWRKNFDPIKERRNTILLWICLHVYLSKCGTRRSLNI